MEFVLSLLYSEIAEHVEQFQFVLTDCVAALGMLSQSLWNHSKHVQHSTIPFPGLALNLSCHGIRQVQYTGTSTSRVVWNCVLVLLEREVGKRVKVFVFNIIFKCGRILVTSKFELDRFPWRSNEVALAIAKTPQLNPSVCCWQGIERRLNVLFGVLMIWATASLISVVMCLFSGSSFPFEFSWLSSSLLTSVRNQG